MRSRVVGSSNNTWRLHRREKEYYNKKRRGLGENKEREKLDGGRVLVARSNVRSLVKTTRSLCVI
jgi:hypothetical protein